MYRIANIILLLLLVVFTQACSKEDPKASSQEKERQASSPPQRVEIMISAAASLTDALNELKLSFEKEHHTIAVHFNFGSSGKLAKQIEQGAPSDVFLSASKKDMDSLGEKKLILEESRVDFAHNKLVLISPKESPMTYSSFEQIKTDEIQHIAMGEPEIVPAGRYAKQVLESIRLWEPLQGKLVLGSDVRQVLTYVESGNAEVGVVYSSDAVTSNKVKVMAFANPEWHDPIVYPGAIIAGTQHKEEAQAFLSYVSSDMGNRILEKYGFE